MNQVNLYEAKNIAKRYGNFRLEIQYKLAEYKNEVEEKTFPTKEHFINSSIHIEKAQ